MKMKGRMMLLLTLIVAVALSAISYKGIGSKKALSVHRIEQGLDLSGGVDIVYEADQKSVTDDEMKAAISLLQGRLDWKGWTEAEVAREGDKRIRVQIPGVEDAEEAIQEIGQTAQLSFADEDGNVLLTGDMVKDATKQVGSTSKNGASQPYVALEFNKEGTERFAEATSNNIGKQIYIIMDNEVISAPTVQTAITNGQAMITGSFTAEGAEQLASLIRAGSLPFNLNVIQMKNVGARLGADALSTGIKAGIIGIALVLIYMLFAYKLLGFAADWALAIYIGLEMVALSLFHVTLTLPGIAGIVLSVGMAVDANVIIISRIREEIASGKSVITAMKNGFHKAMSAILDGNITTLIAAIVLMGLGSGTVKGFAYTLMIGIILSMFTALVVTRWILYSFYWLGLRDEKFYGRAKERKTINFLQKRYVFFAISIAVIAAGFIGMGVHKASGQNSLNYGLDFMGGTSTTADFGKEYTIEDIENDIIPVVKACEGTNIAVGAENMYFEEKGAYTGEISPNMLTDAGVKYVIIGHSERREYFAETDETVNKKVLKAFEHGLTPIICCGETLTQREQGITLDWIRQQIKIAFQNVTAEQAKTAVIAYEPIWAIGTGKVATTEQAEEVCGAIRACIKEVYDEATAEAIRIQYGGSVSAASAPELFAQPDIDGGLVGGASLKADFGKIVNYK